MDPTTPPREASASILLPGSLPGEPPTWAETLLAPLIDRLVESNEGADTYLAFIRTGQLGILVNPLKEAVVGDLTQPLWILLGTVGFVLLIACANVANLVLVRAESRQREMAVRAAVGAGRNDIFRHFMAESAVLAILGGVCGIFLAWIGVPALLALTPDGLPRAGEIGIGAPVLAFTGGLVLLAMLVFGTAPALRFFGGNYQPALGSSRGTTAGRNRHRVRNLLVAGQAALALILLVGSGLMLRSFDQLQSLNPGFDPEGVLTFQVNLPRGGLPECPRGGRLQPGAHRSVVRFAGCHVCERGKLRATVGRRQRYRSPGRRYPLESRRTAAHALVQVRGSGTIFGRCGRA